MEIPFTRGEGGTYTTVALRDDGVLLRVPTAPRRATSCTETEPLLYACRA